MKNADIKLQYPGKEDEATILLNTNIAVIEEKQAFGNYAEGEWVNKLIRGDNLSVLKTLYLDPEINGHVRLIYIDPPFATGRVFDNNDDLTRHDDKVYDDTLVSFEYLEFLRQRLIFMREILANDGSIYVHLDQKMAPYVKVLMDEIFNKANFRNWISRKKCHPKGFTKKGYGNIHDVILFYTRNSRFVWNRPLERLTPEKVRSSEYIYVEEGTNRIYKKVPLHAPGIRYGGTGQPWKGKMPPKGKHWQYTPQQLDKFDEQGKIFWSRTGNPRLKIYLDEREGILIQDIWLNFQDPINQFTYATNYPTEKNQAMLEMIVNTSSKDGDIVMDCFSGSGTTLVAAEKMKRSWIGIDSSPIAIETSVKRLLDLIRKHELELKGFKTYEVSGL